MEQQASEARELKKKSVTSTIAVSQTQRRGTIDGSQILASVLNADALALQSPQSSQPHPLSLRRSYARAKSSRFVRKTSSDRKATAFFPDSACVPVAAASAASAVMPSA